MVGMGVGCPIHGGTVPDSVDSDDLDFEAGPVDSAIPDGVDPACSGGSRDGGCKYSCERELGHLNGKVYRLEDLVRLLVADTGLAGWEETRRVENLKRKKQLEREGAERDHAKRVAAERAMGEEKKKLAQRGVREVQAEEVRKSQEVAATLLLQQRTATRTTLEVAIADYALAKTPEELVPMLRRWLKLLKK